MAYIMRGRKLMNWPAFGEKCRGFTLVEVVLVVTVILTLALVSLPIVQDKIVTARIVAAQKEIENLYTAIATFFNETTEFPTRKGADRNKIEVLRSGVDSTLDPKFVTGIPVLWGLTEVDTLNNHLLKDNPGGTANGYKDNNKKWNGPYISDVGTDPWGRNYLVIAKGLYNEGTDASPIHAWILSGGPNETIETDKDSDKLNSDVATGLSVAGDDIGILVFPAK